MPPRIYKVRPSKWPALLWLPVIPIALLLNTWLCYSIDNAGGPVAVEVLLWTLSMACMVAVVIYAIVRFASRIA
jgi:hypothetical protein